MLGVPALCVHRRVCGLCAAAEIGVTLQVAGELKPVGRTVARILEHISPSLDYTQCHRTLTAHRGSRP
jgi:hypothetical protein